MKISKKDFVYLLEQTLDEMPMEFPTTISTKQKNPNFNPNAPESRDNPKFIDKELPFTERPSQDIQRKLQTQDNPMKKVPMPQGQGNQNFQEMLASETYREVIKRVKEATGGRQGNLMGLMMDCFHQTVEAEREHRPELERLAVQSVFNIFKIPENRFNVHAKLLDFGSIPMSGFKSPQQNDDNPEAPDVEDEPVVAPEIDSPEEMAIEDDYVDKLENFNLERAKRRLMNAMIQGAAHSAYNLYKYVQDQLRQIIGPLPGGKDIMDLYAVMMSVNDTNYWHMSDQQIVSLQSAVAGKAHVVFAQQAANPQNDDQNGQMGNDDGQMGDDDDDDNNNNNNQGGDENEQQPVDTLGNPIDPSKTQIYVHGVNFPVLFHEMIKGIQKLLAGHGGKFQGYDQSNPRHVDFMEKVKQYEDVLDHEMWDLRLGPAIWQRYRLAHPDSVIDPDQEIELQSLVQGYINELPARKYLALMKEIMAGTPRAKAIVQTLVNAVKKMLADEDYEDAIQQYEDEVDEIDNETSDDALSNLLRGIPGVRLSDDEDDDDYDDDDDGGEYAR